MRCVCFPWMPPLPANIPLPTQYYIPIPHVYLMCTNVFVEITKRYGFLYPFRWRLTTVNINVVLLPGFGTQWIQILLLIPPKIYISTLLLKWRHIKFNAGFMSKPFSASALWVCCKGTWLIQNVNSRQRKGGPLSSSHAYLHVFRPTAADISSLTPCWIPTAWTLTRNSTFYTVHLCFSCDCL
jgi:hypothetical protein